MSPLEKHTHIVLSARRQRIRSTRSGASRGVGRRRLSRGYGGKGEREGAPRVEFRFPRVVFSLSEGRV